MNAILHSPRAYDFLAWLLLGDDERVFRDRTLDRARVAPGETVLDVGCGTGTLAILAAQRVGPAGTAHGVDASPEMIDAARRKAKREGVRVAFEQASVDALPFPAGTFDVVLGTLMLHHLPPRARVPAVREAHRVAKPGARIVVVDFGAPARERRSMLDHFHRHGHTPPGEVTRVLTEAGLVLEESGPLGVRDLHVAVARVP